MKNTVVRWFCSRSFRAFTLSEMLVSVVVFVFVMTLAFNTLLAASAVRKAAMARIGIYQNSWTVLDIIGNELRTATLRKTDTRVILGEDPNSLTNARGRLILNDWPPVDVALNATLQDGSRAFIGNGLDDDNDGSTDEEAFDRKDNDGDGEEDSPTHPTTNEALADGLDNDGNGFVDEGIDEDIFYPRDMINFLTLVDSGSGADLIEIGYAIDTRTGRDLLRRSAFKSAVNSPIQVDGLYQVAVQYLDGDFEPVPAILTPDLNTTDLTVPWFNPDNPDFGREVDSAALPLTPSVPLQPPGEILQVVDLISFDILGFDCKAYYYDWVIAEENSLRNPFSDFSKTVDFTRVNQRFNPYSFPALSWDSSVEWRSADEEIDVLAYDLNSIIPILPNGADDMAVVPGSDHFEDFTSDIERVAAAIEKTDGLPRLIEVTLFVQDPNRYRTEPVQISTRVFLPFVTGDE